LPWEALTADQQETAAKLGYAQDSWDEWEDLTEEQQQLWDVLGWTAENWATGDGVESENLSWSEMNAEQREAAEELGFVQDSWDEWDDLPAEKQKLWGVLGWTVENWSNNTYGEGVESENVSWNGLSQAQREAAEELGFVQDTWDEWDDLSADKQKLWGVLGWTAENWATGDGVESENLSWSEMSAEQIEAAEGLGLSADVWDGNWVE